MKIDTCMYTCCNFKYICFKVCFQVCFQVCLLVIEGLYSYDTNNIIIQIGYCMILLLLLLIIMNHMIIYIYMIKQFIYDKQPHHQEVPLRCHHFIAIFGIYSQSNGILWKKCAYPPGIVNQGRRSICPVHCLHFRHRQLRNVGLALRIVGPFFWTK